MKIVLILEDQPLNGTLAAVSFRVIRMASTEAEALDTPTLANAMAKSFEQQFAEFMDVVDRQSPVKPEAEAQASC